MAGGRWLEELELRLALQFGLWAWQYMYFNSFIRKAKYICADPIHTLIRPIKMNPSVYIVAVNTKASKIKCKINVKS